MKLQNSNHFIHQTRNKVCRLPYNIVQYFGKYLQQLVKSIEEIACFIGNRISYEPVNIETPGEFFRLARYVIAFQGFRSWLVGDITDYSIGPCYLLIVYKAFRLLFVFTLLSSKKHPQRYEDF